MENVRTTLAQMGHNPEKHTENEANILVQLNEAFENSSLPLAQRLQNFPRHVRRQDIARFLAKFEIFKLSLKINGNIIECGVFAGGGLLSWAQFSYILEPYNYTRKIIGFDTFSGFPSVHEKDLGHGLSGHLHKNALQTTESIIEEIQQLVQIHDQNRPLGHISRIELVAGDATKTIPEYLDKHPHLLISLLYLDFDLYEPTKSALDLLYPRIPKGGIVAFDELNSPEFPGETVALIETLNLSDIRICRFPFEPYISYFIKE